MIELTRLNGKRFSLNAELVESVEATPDTTIRLTNNKTYMVQEDCEAVCQAVREYYRVLRLPAGPQPPQGWSVITTEEES
mgnify:FL=1|jgi:flagellar protein FlbD